jgi:hypothetical protein
MHDYAIAQLEEALAKTEREHAVLVEAVAQGTRVLQAALRVEAAQAIPDEPLMAQQNLQQHHPSFVTPLIATALEAMVAGTAPRNTLTLLRTRLAAYLTGSLQMQFQAAPLRQKQERAASLAREARDLRQHQDGYM